MSWVFEARDTRNGTAIDGQSVALKLLADSPQNGHSARTTSRRTTMCVRLQREARAIARLSHPNIVAIYEIGEHNGQHFIAMEYLPAKTLRAWLNEHGRCRRPKLRAFWIGSPTRSTPFTLKTSFIATSTRT
jgi:serine/threonine protein kinase